MNYELAKQLKDAGFPQNTEWAFVTSPHDRDSIPRKMLVDTKGYTNLISSNYEVFSAPTLSELIEACGIGFRDLCYHPDGFYIGDGSKKFNTNRDDIWHCELEPSSTPEEAVAKLWLELNKK